MDQDNCGLCQGWERLGLAAWGRWDPGLTRPISRGQQAGAQWTAAIQELLANDPEGLPEMTEQQIAEHFHHHQPVQPAAKKGIPRGQAIYGLQALGPELENVVIAVFRMHKMTTAQIQEAFFPDKSIYQVDDLLAHAAQGHYLYRVFTDPAELDKRKGLKEVLGERLTRGSTLWYLGRAGAVYIQEKLQLDYKVSYTRDQQQISAATLAHDLKAARIGITLTSALRQDSVSEYQQQRLQVSNNPRNWLGPTTQGLIMGYWYRPEIRWAQIMPDGMIGINVEESALGTGGTVLFIEYDHGSKDRQEVVDQLWAYNALAESGAVAARFPQLADWTVPMLMVFSSRQRMENMASDFRAQFGRQQPFAPLWFVAEEDWLADPLAAIIGNFWGGAERQQLLPLWLDSSRELIPRLAINQGLEINQRGAPVRNERGQKAAPIKEEKKPEPPASGQDVNMNQEPRKDPGKEQDKNQPEERPAGAQPEAGHPPLAPDEPGDRGPTGPEAPGDHFEPDFSAAANNPEDPPQQQQQQHERAADNRDQREPVDSDDHNKGNKKKQKNRRPEQNKQQQNKQSKDRQPPKQNDQQQAKQKKQKQQKQPKQNDQQRQQKKQKQSGPPATPAPEHPAEQQSGKGKKKKSAAIKAAPAVEEAQRWSRELIAAYQHLATLQAQGQKIIGPSDISELPPVADDPQQPTSPGPLPEQEAMALAQEAQQAARQPERSDPQPVLPGDQELPPPVQSPDGGPSVANQALSATQPSAPSPPAGGPGDDFPELAPGGPAVDIIQQQQAAAASAQQIAAQQPPAPPNPPEPPTPEPVDQQPPPADQDAPLPGEDFEQYLSRQADQARRRQA